MAIVFLVAQFVAAGYALWSAETAARAGARAEYVGGDGRDVALQALPPGLRAGAEVHEGEGVSVTVRAAAPAPGVPGLPVTARSATGTGGTDG